MKTTNSISHRQDIKVFLSYPMRREPRRMHYPTDALLKLSLVEDAFSHLVGYYLRKQTNLDVFCYDLPQTTTKISASSLWRLHVAPHLTHSDIFVVFLGGAADGTAFRDTSQYEEYDNWRGSAPHRKHKLLIAVKLRGRETVVPKDIVNPLVLDIRPQGGAMPDVDRQTACKCASAIYSKIPGCRSHPFWIDGIPLGYPFEYEKQIIDAFVAEGPTPFSHSFETSASSGMLLRSPDRLAAGSLVKWPDVARRMPRALYPPLPKSLAGEYRTDCFVVEDARGKYNGAGGSKSCLYNLGLKFPEAGPRKRIVFGSSLRVGIVVSGGIAPGINAVLEGIIERHSQYFESSKNGGSSQLVIKAFKMGLWGIANCTEPELIPFSKKNTNRFQDRGDLASRIETAKAHGGSEVTTARNDDLLEGRPERIALLDRILDNLSGQKPAKNSTGTTDGQVDILYVIGGEGSMRAAHALATRAKARKIEISIVGVPKTMDNDILWVWQSFGFLSAVEKAREILAQLDTESKSNPRLCVMQLFGSDSGFVASHTALAGAASCLAALIPEVHFSMDRLSKDIGRRYYERGHGILAFAETAVPVDIQDFVEHQKVGLSNNEKAVVRNFVCSAMVTEDEFRDLPVCVRVVNRLIINMRENSELPINLSGSDRTSLSEIYERIKDSESITLSDKSAIVSIVNRLMGRCFSAWKDARPSMNHLSNSLLLFGEAVLQGIHILPDFRKNRAKKALEVSRDVADQLHSLSLIMCLPYEATAIIREIQKDFDVESEHRTVRISTWLLEQLNKRLCETY